MNTALKVLAGALMLSAGGGLATAQQAPSPTPATSNAQLDAGEPRANVAPASGTSVAGPSADAPGVAAPPNPASGATAPAQHNPPKSTATARAPGAGNPKAAATDRLNLGTATVTGDHEQPKVMYIVPWKSSNIGDLSGKPMNSLLDEALAPVDRDEFKREVAYYDAVRANALQNGASAPGAPAPAAPQGEK